MSDITTVPTTEQRMAAAGVATEDRRQQSYFGFSEKHKFYLPDGVSYIEHQTLNEGARKKYLDDTNRDLRIQRATGDALMRMQAGTEKHALLALAISGWNLVDADGSPVQFRDNTLKRFLNEANPKIIDDLEKDIRKHNAWLLTEMSLEDIDKQISDLQEMREQKVKEEEGKGS